MSSWYFIPRSGVVFIFLSILFIVYWMNHKELPFVNLVIAESVLFLICFFFARKEAKK